MQSIARGDNMDRGEADEERHGEKQGGVADSEEWTQGRVINDGTASVLLR